MAKRRKKKRSEPTTPAPSPDSGQEASAVPAPPETAAAEPTSQTAPHTTPPVPDEARPRVERVGPPGSITIDPARRGTPAVEVTIRNRSLQPLDLAVTVESPGAAAPSQLHLARNGEATFRVAVAEEDAAGLTKLTARVVQAATGTLVLAVPVFLKPVTPDN